MIPAECPARLPAGLFHIEAASVEQHASTLHAWMNDPSIARFWALAKPRPFIAEYLRAQDSSAHSTAWIGLLDGEPMSYWELYEVSADPLAQYYAVQPGDVGVHLLVGPAHLRGRGIGSQLLSAVVETLFACRPTIRRVVAEPDRDNIASVRTFERSGFRHCAELRMPDKVAALLMRDRDAEAVRSD